MNGGRDVSHLPHEWQKIVHDVIGMKQRIKFGLQILDRDLDEKQKLAVESFQVAIDKKSEKH